MFAGEGAESRLLCVGLWASRGIKSILRPTGVERSPRIGGVPTGCSATRCPVVRLEYHVSSARRSSRTCVESITATPREWPLMGESVRREWIGFVVPMWL